MSTTCSALDSPHGPGFLRPPTWQERSGCIQALVPEKWLYEQENEAANLESQPPEDGGGPHAIVFPNIS